MSTIFCPNCDTDVESLVRRPVAVLCNGRGEHITSATPMTPQERVKLLKTMEHRKK